MMAIGSSETSGSLRITRDWKTQKTTKLTKLRGLSPQANYTDRATAAVGEVVPTFAGRGVYTAVIFQKTLVSLIDTVRT
jgi:hypothetical protein